MEPLVAGLQNFHLTSDKVGGVHKRPTETPPLEDLTDDSGESTCQAGLPDRLLLRLRMRRSPTTPEQIMTSVGAKMTTLRCHVAAPRFGHRD